MDLAPSPTPIPQPSDCPTTDNTSTVEAYVVVAIVALFLLHIFGSLRRLSSSSVLHAVVTAVYTLSYPLVAYTIGTMRSSHWVYYDFGVWAVFLLLVLGSTDSLTACRLNDIDGWKSIYVKHLFKGFLLVCIALNMGRRTPYLAPLTAILLVVVLKWYVMIASMRTVSKSYLCKNVKGIAEYMQHKDNPVVSFDPKTMEGYRYLVAGETCYVQRRPPGGTPWYKEDGLKVTTVEHVWQCTGSLLLHERGKRLRDKCLSMALSKMLNRRFAGFKLSEAGLEKTHDLVFKGLLVDGDDKQPYHRRVFRVIEEELVFVHDFYYTRYYYLYQKGRYLALCLPVTMFALCLWLTCRLLKYPSFCQGATVFITVVLALLEAYQLYLYITSSWFKVALILSYVTTPFLQRSGSFLETVIGLLLRWKAFRPWKNRLGQYCILKELGHKGRVWNCLHYATLHLVDKAKHDKGHKKSVKLSENVKKAIVDSLLRSNGYLTNGVTSLQNNGVHDRLSWACEDATGTDGSVTRTILVWHIATALCKHELDAEGKNGSSVKNEDDAVTTATTLSQYCMHLIVFAPNLLPDHSSISESILGQSIDEARNIIKQKAAKTMQASCDMLLKMSTNDGEASLLAHGGHLARDLMEHIQEPALRWKVLSDFWAEMMLYVSPSDDARAHLEALARGGEFITHLWALLTHAGVLNRRSTGTSWDVV